METALKCPHCGGENIHHDEVRVFARRAEDAPGMRVIVQPGGDTLVASVSEGFAGRRDDVRIRFTCEGCPKVSWLYVVQHKGSTYMEWLESDHGSVASRGIAPIK